MGVGAAMILGFLQSSEEGRSCARFCILLGSPLRRLIARAVGGGEENP